MYVKRAKILDYSYVLVDTEAKRLTYEYNSDFDLKKK